MRIENLTALTKVKSIIPFETFILGHYKVIVNNEDMGYSQARPVEDKIELPEGIELVVSSNFKNCNDLILLTIVDYNYKDIIIDHSKLKDIDNENLCSVSLEIERNELEQKFEIVELYDFNNPNLKYAAERVVVCRRLLEYSNYKPSIPEPILKKRDELYKERNYDLEKMGLHGKTTSDYYNELICFMEDYLEKNSKQAF